MADEYTPSVDPQKLIDEAHEFERASHIGKPTARELGRAILLIRRLWPALDAAISGRGRTVAHIKAEAIREYVTAARENPSTYDWSPSGVLDDAEQWADEIEKGTI